MKVLLWEMGDLFYNIVLWDGENTYWSDEMKPSHGYLTLEPGWICPVTKSRYTLIGEL